MNNLTLTVSLDEEAKRLITALISAIEKSHPNCEECASHVCDMFASVTTPEQEQEKAFTSEVKNEQPEVKQPEERQEIHPVDRKLVQDLVVSLVRSGKKKEAAAIIHQYGESVSTLPDTDLGTVYEALKSLEAA